MATLHVVKHPAGFRVVRDILAADIHQAVDLRYGPALHFRVQLGAPQVVLRAFAFGVLAFPLVNRAGGDSNPNSNALFLLFVVRARHRTLSS